MPKDGIEGVVCLVDHTLMKMDLGGHMSGIGNTSGSAANSRRKRIIKVAPMTRAVRLALAASLAALALGTSGGAFAAGCKTPTAVMIPCTQAATDATPVLDLTLVPHAAAPSALIMPLAISQSSAGDVVINNAVPISELNFNYSATAISGYSSGGSVDITNQATGTLEAISALGNATGIEGYAYGNVTIDNSGDIYAGSIYGDAVGIYGYSIAGDVSIDNSGDITGISYYGLADGIFVSGADVDVTNAGSIQVAGSTWAAGIEAQGTGTTAVTNDGDIYAVVLDTASAFGIYATGDVIQIDNAGSIEAQGYYATGIEAQGGSSVTVTNDNDIVAGSATTSALATGINATSNYAGGAITITNNGGVSANGYFGGTGIAATATGTGGSASVSNNGSIYASQYSGNGYGAYGIIASADGDATIDNNLTGSITVVSAGNASGAAALSFAGDASVTNAGDISVDGYSGADGIVSFAQNGAAYAGNSGNIEVGSAYTGTGMDVGGLQGATADNSGDIAVDAYRAYGIRANSGAGDVSADNSGSIYATYTGTYSGTAFGIFATSTQGNVSVDNAGQIDTSVTGQSVGIFASATNGDVDVSSSDTISAYSTDSTAVGIFARADYGVASVDNSGAISAESYNDNAFGVLARGEYVDVSNSGDIDATGYLLANGIAARSYYGTSVTTTGGSITAYALGEATGIDARSSYGDVAVANASDIQAEGVYYGGTGINVDAYGDATVSNAGDVYATSLDGDAIGVHGYTFAGDLLIGNAGMIKSSAQGAAGSYAVWGESASGDITINNSGTIMASSDYDATAISMYALYGATTVNNSGTLRVGAPLESQVAVHALGTSKDTINNSGQIFGGLITEAGDDTVNNLNQGVWHVENHATDLGDGNDTINNKLGGTIILQDGGIYMGGGTANAFNNLGTIKVNGDGLVDMGTGNTVALNNAGLISFLDGGTDDSLTIVGNLGGTGAISIDLDLDNRAADQIYVDGNMTAGAMQRVNVAFIGLPTAAHSSAAFAHVSGTSIVGNFVAGQILGYNSAPNFLALGLTVTSQISATNTTDDVFSVNLDVNGLNDTGALAASVASGAAGMLNAQIGTFKQRMGVNPYGDAGKVMSAFFRVYSSEGDVSPTHTAANFGQGGNFDYDQAVWGREVGVNANLFDGFHAGLVLGTADGRQRLTGNGVGQNRMDGMTWGMYATWFAPQGFYVDVSGRWMAVDVHSISAAGPLQTRAHTGAWNIESGYQWKLGSLSIVPQLQYTRTKVDGVRSNYGSAATFDSHGGTSSRGRLGVEVSKAFQTAGGMTITPYGSLNAIREFEGDMNYTVANVFNGTTSIQGTSTMAELGLGVQKGGWGVSIGANWVDGGAYKSTVGGQALVRFAW